ncbi:MAG: DHH family phosphoesterase [Anaerolineales bacterium]
MTLPLNPDLDSARQLLAGAKRILTITHINPDGDAIGSLLGFGLALRQAGKEVVMACADPVPDVFRFLPAVTEITAKPEGEFDVVVVLDVSDPPRMGSVGAALPRKPDIQFDHHITNPHFAAINFVEAEAASTAELVAELLPGLGLALSDDVAQCLLTGLVNDTLGFRTSNTTVKTLAIAQQLMAVGGKLHSIYDLSLFKRSFTAVRLWAEGLARMRLKNRIVWASLPLEARQASGYQGSGDADLINVLTSVREADVAIIFVERPDGLVKLSWRSVPGINVATVAAGFGGGGHAQAAGAEIAGTLAEVEERVLKATRAALQPAPALPAV